MRLRTNETTRENVREVAPHPGPALGKVGRLARPRVPPSESSSNDEISDADAARNNHSPIIGYYPAVASAIREQAAALALRHDARDRQAEADALAARAAGEDVPLRRRRDRPYRIDQGAAMWAALLLSQLRYLSDRAFRTAEVYRSLSRWREDLGCQSDRPVRTAIAALEALGLVRKSVRVPDRRHDGIAVLHLRLTAAGRALLPPLGSSSGSSSSSKGGSSRGAGPPPPMTSPQREFIENLRKRLGWSPERLEKAIRRQVAGLTMREAGKVIDELKRRAKEAESGPPPAQKLTAGAPDAAAIRAHQARKTVQQTSKATA